MDNKLIMHVRGDAPSMFTIVDDECKVFKNWRGTRIARHKGLVGKAIGGGVYVHKQYAHLVIPEHVLYVALNIVEIRGFEYNCIHYKECKPDVLRFDEAPDFDTAYEPMVGKMLTVNIKTGRSITTHSNMIWHHKWLWVMDDYDGFDVQEAYEWSKCWSKEVSSPPGVKEDWEKILSLLSLGVPRFSLGNPSITHKPSPINYKLKIMKTTDIDKVLHGITVINNYAEYGDEHAQRCLFNAVFGDKGNSIYFDFYVGKNAWEFVSRLDVGDKQLFADFCDDTEPYQKNAQLLKHRECLDAAASSAKTAMARADMSKPTSWLCTNSNIKGRVLDYGCGRGRDVTELRLLGYDVVGYDPYHSGWDARPDGQFNTIICNYVLNVIGKDDQWKVLDDIKSLLAPGGMAFITVRREPYIKDAGQFSSTGTFQRKVVLSHLQSIKRVKGQYEMYMMTR